MAMCDSSLAQHPPALPSPKCTPSPEHKGGKMSSSSAVDERYSGKRISRKGVKSVPAEHDDMHLKIGKGYLRLPEEGKLNWVAGLRNLTSITSPALLPWHIMCMSSLKTCHINVEVVTCASLNFAIPSSAVIPNQNGCRIEKLSAQVPIEFLYDAYLRDGVFQYLPAVIHLAPRLLYLALHLTRKEGSGTHPGDEHDESGYDTLLQDMQSDSLETLIIDTCDVEPASVRQPRTDFFESISHLTSLHSFPNLRRVVAPQEAFISVPNLLSSDANPVFVPPTVLFPRNIETVEIIDSTSALDTWAKRLLDAHDAPTGLRVRRGGRERELFSSGAYGEYATVEERQSETTNQRAVEIMKTGVTVFLNMGCDQDDESDDAESVGEVRESKTLQIIRQDIWDLMDNAGIVVEKKEDEPRGWRM